MRENRTYGSEGGDGERRFRPLYQRGRLFAPLFGEAKSGSAAGPNTRLASTAVETRCFTRQAGAARASCFVLQPSGNGNVKGDFAATTFRRMKQCGMACQTTKPGLGPAADLLLLLRQEK